MLGIAIAQPSLRDLIYAVPTRRIRCGVDVWIINNQNFVKTMDKTFEITTSYQVKYTNKTPVSISEIVKSLQAYERLLHLTPAFIERAYVGIRIVDVEVYVKTLESGSLIEDFAIRYVFKGEENYEQAKQAFLKIMDNNEALRLTVAVGVGAILTYGVVKAMSSNSPSLHIENVHHSIVNVGAKTDLSEHDIQSVLESMPDKKKIAKDAIDALSPARSDSSASIEVDGFDELTFTPEAIAEAPKEYIAPEPDEQTLSYTNVDLVIYASDRDKQTQGWAGLAPGIVDKRVKFELGADIEPAKLHGRVRIKADISVISKFNRAKKAFEPKQILVRKVM